jgi:hypothetical protein
MMMRGWGLDICGLLMSARGIAKMASVLTSGGRMLFTAPRVACSWRDAMTGQTSISLGFDEYRKEFDEGLGDRYAGPTSQVAGAGAGMILPASRDELRRDLLVAVRFVVRVHDGDRDSAMATRRSLWRTRFEITAKA